METVLILLIIILIVLVLALYFKREKTSPELLEYLKTTNIRLSEQNKDINERLDNATKVVSQVGRNIGEFSEIGRGMKELQDFLKSPKLRGNIGESVLKDMLSQFLPKQYFKLQFVFKSGEKVDAAVITSGGIIPIDSKFPMENFRRMINDTSFKSEFTKDVKKHIDNISRKYILTSEGTVDYALMYIPSEAVYYEIANDEDLFDYASEKRILPVSPSIFYAYLKAILMSFEGQKIESRAKEILSAIHAIRNDYNKVAENLSVLQKHLTNAYNMMGTVLNIFSSLGNKIVAAKSLDSAEKHSSKEIYP